MHTQVLRAEQALLLGGNSGEIDRVRRLDFGHRRAPARAGCRNRCRCRRRRCRCHRPSRRGRCRDGRNARSRSRPDRVRESSRSRHDRDDVVRTTYRRTLLTMCAFRRIGRSTALKPRLPAASIAWSAVMLIEREQLVGDIMLDPRGGLERCRGVALQIRTSQ